MTPPGVNYAKVWAWRCLFNKCTSRHGKDHKLKTLTGAQRHADGKPGHNVIVTYLDGDSMQVLYSTIQTQVRPDYESKEALF